MNFNSNAKPTIQIVRKSKEPPNSEANAKADLVDKKVEKPFSRKKKSIAFVSFELTHNSPEATIIQMNKLTLVKGVERQNTFIYSNNGTPISPEATAHHGISETTVRYKRKIRDFNLQREDFYVVWDGRVVKKLLWVNEVSNYSRIINLHLLARYFSNNRQPIRMVSFAAQILNKTVNELKQELNTPINKLKVLSDIYEAIRKMAREKYGEDTPEFLAKISKARTIDDVPHFISEYLEKKQLLDAKRKQYDLKKSAKETNKVGSK